MRSAMLVQLFVQNAMIVLSGTQFPECGASYNSECVCDFRLITFAGRKGGDRTSMYLRIRISAEKSSRSKSERTHLSSRNQASRPVRRMRSGSEDITDGPMSGLWKGTRGDIPEGLGLGYTARGPGHGTVTLSPPRKKNLRSDKPEM